MAHKEPDYIEINCFNCKAMVVFDEYDLVHDQNMLYPEGQCEQCGKRYKILYDRTIEIKPIKQTKLANYVEELELIIYECVSLREIMLNGLSEATYRHINNKYDKD